MKVGLLLHNDGQVAEYLFQHHVSPRMQYDAALGILTDGVLTGGILLQSWNGFNVELSYYGHGTLTPGIIRCLARVLISAFNPSRVTVTVSRKRRSVMRGLRKLGFAVEGTQRRFYGVQDISRNTGVRFVMFRERVEQLAQLERRAAG
jgi:hypothetical protein